VHGANSSTIVLLLKVPFVNASMLCYTMIHAVCHITGFCEIITNLLLLW
jgi:hypothetical protein